MDDTSSKVMSLTESWRLFLGRGMRYLGEGEHARALESFERALREAPEEPQVLLAVGRERLRQGCFTEAEHCLRAAHRLAPTSEATVAALARLLGLHLGQREEAFDLIHQALGAGGPSPALQVIRGEILLEEGAYNEARAAFALGLEDPLAAEPARLGLARSYNAEGIALSERGELEPAIFAFKRAADLDPLWAGPHVNQGVAFDRLGHPSKALEAYAAALEREGENPVARFNMALAQQGLGRWTEAVATLEELLLVVPDYPHVRGVLAHALCALREFDRAIALFLEELEIDSRCVSCWSSLGLAYVCSGSPERGEECLLQALQLDPDYVNAIHNLVTLYLAQKRYDDAEGLLEQALRLDPQRTAHLIATDGRFESIRELPRGRPSS